MERRIAYEDLLGLTEAILNRIGYPEKAAEITARTLVEADARGVYSHGVARLPFYRSRMESGNAFPEAKPEIVWETPFSLVIDGKRGIGPYNADFAMKECIERARKGGLCFASVRDSNHYGMAGLWAEMAVDRGFLGISMSTSNKLVLPTFSSERLLGTNPLAVAIPAEEGAPFLLDMATSGVARGKIEVCHRRDISMPSGWAVDRHGEVCTNPHEIVALLKEDAPWGGLLPLGGSGETSGGHKGYGLALLVELLSSSLSLNEWRPRADAEHPIRVAHFFGVLDLKIFGDPEKIRSHVSRVLEDIRKKNVPSETPRIYVHGEKERERRKRSLGEGICLDDATREILRNLREELSLSENCFTI